MKTKIQWAICAAMMSAASLSAFAGANYTWTGRGGDMKWKTASNWEVTGTASRAYPSWTDNAYFDTDKFGGDITVIIDTDDNHANLLMTTGSGKVTFNTTDDSVALRPYWVYLRAANNEFNITLNPHSISANRDFQIYSSATFNRDVYIPDNTIINNRSDVNGSCLGVSPNAVHFYGTVTVSSGKVLGLRRAPYTTAATVHFHGPLICDELRFGLGWVSGYAYFYSQENQIGDVKWFYSNFVCQNTDVWPSGVAVSWPSSLVNPVSGANELYYESSSTTYTAFNLNGFDQSATKVAYEHASRRPWIYSPTPATLTLNGSGNAVANVRVGGKVSVVVDSSSLVQEFADAQSDTSGDLEVRNGTLRISGTSSFADALEVRVGSGGTFELASSANGALGGVTNLVVAAGGVFKVESGVSSPLGTDFSVRLGAGAVINTAADIVISSGLWVDGIPLASGTYTAGPDAPWLVGAGTVTVNVPNVEATYVWTGLGADNKVSNKDNWEGRECPVFTSTLATYVFPYAGSVASPLEVLVDVPIICKELNFTSSNGGCVLLTAENDGYVRIVSGGVNVTNGTSRVLSAVLELPVEYSGALTVRAGNDATTSNGYSASFIGSLDSIGAADIFKYGYGYLAINGDGNTIQGNIHNYQGCLQLEGEDPVGGGNSYSIYNYPNAGDLATLVNLFNATVNRNIVTRNPSDTCGPTLRILGVSTINGHIGNNAGGVSNSGHMRIHLGDHEHVGELTVNGNIVAHNNGFFILTGATGYLKCTGLIDCVRVYCDSASPVVLDIANVARGLAGSNYGWYMKIPVRISKDNCIARETQGDQYYMCYSGEAGIDLNGHTLTLANFGCSAAAFEAGGCFIKGGAGSKLTLSGAENDNIGIRILEGASLVRAGTGITTISDVCSSTGTLEVVSGTVAFVDDGNWASASGVTVGGGAALAKLILEEGNAFGGDSVLDVRANGQIEVADGVICRVGELWLGGVKQRNGFWGSAESGATNKNGDYLAGKGIILVGDVGSCFIIR